MSSKGLLPLLTRWQLPPSGFSDSALSWISTVFYWHPSQFTLRVLHFLWTPNIHTAHDLSSVLVCIFFWWSHPLLPISENYCISTSRLTSPLNSKPMPPNYWLLSPLRCPTDGHTDGQDWNISLTPYFSTIITPASSSLHAVSETDVTIL